MKKTENFDVYITVTGLNQFPGCRRLLEGEMLSLRPEPENEYDRSAIAVYAQRGKIGYVANSEKTVRKGTLSASQLLEIMDSSVKAEVVEGTYIDALCRVIDVFDVDKITLTAFEYYNSAEYEMALPLFLKLCEKYNSVFLLQYTADCYIKLDNYSEALPFIETALSKESNNKITLMMYGTILEKLGKIIDAAEIYSKILKYDQNEEVQKAYKRCVDSI